MRTKEEIDAWNKRLKYGEMLWESGDRFQEMDEQEAYRALKCVSPAALEFLRYHPKSQYIEYPWEVVAALLEKIEAEMCEMLY